MDVKSKSKSVALDDSLDAELEKIVGVEGDSGRSSPRPSRMANYTSGILALCIILVLFLAFFWYNEKMLKPSGGIVTNISSPSNHVILNLSGENVRKNIYDYLSDTKKDGYFDVVKCSKGSCLETEEREFFPQNMAWLTLGYVGMYESTYDSIYLSKINDTMEDIMRLCYKRINNRCQIDKNVPEACEYIIVQTSKAYGVTKDPRHLQFLKQLGVCLHRPWYFELVPMLESIFAREEFILYRLCANEPDFRNFEPSSFECREFLDVGVQRLANAKNYLNSSYLIYNNNGVEFRQASCWLQLVNLEAYSATGEEAYLSDAKEYFTQIQIGSKIGSAKDNYIVSDILPCLESLIMIKELTNTSEYDYDIWRLDELIVNNHMRNTNAAIDSLPRTGTVNQNVNAVSDNSHFTYLLSKQNRGNITLTYALSTTL